MEKVKRKNKWLWLLKMIISAIILFIVIRKIDLEKTASFLYQSNAWFLLLAFFAFVISKIVSSYRLNRFYHSKGLFLSELLNIKLYMLAMYYSLFIPGVGGDGFKVYWLNRKYAFEIKNLIFIALLDRASGLVALFSLSVIFFLFSSFELPFKSMFFVVIPLTYIAFYFVLRFFFSGLLSVYWITSLQSLIVQLLQVACTYFIILALGVNTLINEYIFIFLVTCLAFVVPVFGVREALFILGAKWVGLDPQLTAAISVLFYCCLALTSFSGIYYFFFPEKLKAEEGKYNVLI